MRFWELEWGLCSLWSCVHQTSNWAGALVVAAYFLLPEVNFAAMIWAQSQRVCMFKVCSSGVGGDSVRDDGTYKRQSLGRDRHCSCAIPVTVRNQDWSLPAVYCASPFAPSSRNCHEPIYHEVLMKAEKYSNMMTLNFKNCNTNKHLFFIQAFC